MSCIRFSVERSNPLELFLQLNGSFGRELVILHRKPSCLVSFWCMLGVCVEVARKNTLIRFDEGQTHFGMPKVLN